MIFFRFSFLFSLFYFAAFSALFAQQLVVVNGGAFGGSNNTNIGLYSIDNQQYTPLDTVGTTAAQDAFIENNRYLYLAASDSIFKYDLVNQTRLASAAFGGWSAIKLGVYQNYLLVGDRVVDVAHEEMNPENETSVNCESINSGRYFEFNDEKTERQVFEEYYKNQECYSTRELLGRLWFFIPYMHVVNGS